MEENAGRRTRRGGQSTLRDTNARRVLTMIRRHGPLSGAELARMTGLSAQAVSNIVRALGEQGLVTAEKVQRGRVGKPSTPISLAARGAHALGLNIGRRGAEIALVDFLGRELASRRFAYAWPRVAEVGDFVTDALAEMLDADPVARATLAGLGVALPYQIWNWPGLVNAPRAGMAEWAKLNVVAWLRGLSGLDVFPGNDAGSACVAENLIGRGGEFEDFAYFFIGAFAGGGLVLDGKLVEGRTGNAAAFGSMPVPDGRGGVTQLLNVASLHLLETRLAADGARGHPLSGDDWSGFDAEVAAWLSQVAPPLAVAVAAVASTVEISTALFDGAFPPAVRGALVRAVRDELSRIDLTGIAPPAVEAAAIGRRARPLGAALLPIHARYFIV